MVNAGARMMHGLEFGSTVAVSHAPLVQRAGAIVAALGQGAPVLLKDAADGNVIAASTTCITLDRSGQPGIVRNASGRLATLRYADPTSEASLAALVACVATPGAPIAADPESLSILALAERLAVSDIPVLINGPTGTGKEVLSRFIHNRSNRKDGPFVAVNCAAMPEAMLEALLFGHKKGAFTGATESNEGFFRAADGGTLLLDEIAEMPIGLQAKLLRALQEGEVVPIGATQPIAIDVRVIACANRDLPTEVAEGRFRADLYYRLNVFPLALRSLRERADDIAPLAFAMLLRHAPAGHAVPWISDAAVAMLKLHGWPGNVRELENVMRRAILLAHGAAEIRPEHIVFDSPARLVSPSSSGEQPAIPMQEMPAMTIPQGSGAGRRKLSNIVQISEARAIMETLEACGGNRVVAASQLGISERTLRYRLASFREAGLAVAGAGR